MRIKYDHELRTYSIYSKKSIDFIFSIQFSMVFSYFEYISIHLSMVFNIFEYVEYRNEFILIIFEYIE
jgi:hypothetical protein